MAKIYKHGTYGNLSDSVSQPAKQSGTVAVYVGTAPVNLVRGYENSVNKPVYLSSFNATKHSMGYSDDWAKFTLCEAFKAHFDNASGNVGPIIAINVLNPKTHKKDMETTKSVTFVNRRAVIESDTIILDTLVLADKVENTDFTVAYDFDKKQAVLTDIGVEPMTTIQATFDEVDTSKITSTDVIGDITAEGVYSGLGCVERIYPELNLIPNIIAAPSWSTDKTVYEAMINAGNKVNGHWDAYVVADIPVASNDTIAKAKTWKTTNGYTSERSKVCWPMGQDSYGTVYHLSTACVWAMLATDAKHGGIPMESPSNKPVFIAKQYFGEGSSNMGFDQTKANELNENGITTAVYWGARWVLWGPHSAAFKHGETSDHRVIFDNSMRMMMHITNSFQADYAKELDGPLNRAKADTIKIKEQEKADVLVATGALIGHPVVEFVESENSTDELVEGNFRWRFEATPTPPFKSGTLQVAYSDSGFQSYFGEEE